MLERSHLDYIERRTSECHLHSNITKCDVCKSRYLDNQLYRVIRVEKDEKLAFCFKFKIQILNENKLFIHA